MARDPGDDDDDLDGDDYDDDDDDGDDDDEDDGEDDDDEEDRGEEYDRRDPAPAPTEPAQIAEPVLAAAPVVESPPAQASPREARTRQGRPPRVGTWLPLSDDRVGYVMVYRAGESGSYLTRLIRPFPPGRIETWLFHAYGPGRYRLLQRGRLPGREYIGSLTVNVTEQPAAAPPPSSNGHASSNGNGNGNGHAHAPISIPEGMSVGVALITVGLPLLADTLKAIASRPQRSDLEAIVAAAKLLNTPNEERSKLFREGMQLAKEVMAENVSSSSGGGEIDWRSLLSGAGEFFRTMRASTPATPAPAPTPTVTPLEEPAAGELRARQGETPEDFVERVIVAEIQRAVGTGDSPECLVILTESWLPGHVVAWLSGTETDEILEELPKRFPKHESYLRGEGVQQFLRSALQMLKEDPDEGEGVSGVREPVAAGAGE